MNLSVLFEERLYIPVQRENIFILFHFKVKEKSATIIMKEIQER